MIDTSPWSSCSRQSPWLPCSGHMISSTGQSVSPFRDFYTHIHCCSGFLRPGAPSEQNRAQSSPDNEEETEVLPEEIPLLPKLLQNMLRSNPSQSSQSPQNVLLLSQNPPYSHCASEKYCNTGNSSCCQHISRLTDYSRFLCILSSIQYKL